MSCAASLRGCWEQAGNLSGRYKLGNLGHSGNITDLLEATLLVGGMSHVLIKILFPILCCSLWAIDVPSFKTILWKYLIPILTRF